MELNSAAETLVELAGIDADSEAVEIELDVLRLTNSPLFYLLNQIAENQQKGKLYEKNAISKENQALYKCA